MSSIFLKYIRYFSLLMVVGVIACQPELPKPVAQAYDKLPEEVDFNLHVKPILSDKCFACHGPDKAKVQAGLQLHTSERAFDALPESGKKAIVSGNLNRSAIFHRIISEDPEMVMPPLESNLTISDYEKAILIKWIEDGAEYKPHWSFIKPELPTIPTVLQENTVQNPIDNFVLQKIESMDWQPVKEASKELLLRRLSFDLTGLPPTVEDINTFLADDSDKAYEKQVDRLLASVHYGEKIATDWMDVARFSDTFGYQVDRYRDMSPWRDWVIKAFNENMPYDQFLTWQLAGDLLPNATREQKLATGFNRLHPQNMEGGIVDEEFRVENVADRVAVLGDGLLGLTLSCAKCHDHKYDPISQKEYYELFSFFNNINETGQIAWDSSTPVPSMLLPTERQENSLKILKDRIDSLQNKVVEITAAEQTAIAKWINKGAYQQLSNALPQKGLIAHYPLDNQLKNSLNARQNPKMDREYSKKEVPNYTEGYRNKGLQLDGDAWLDCKEVGVFRRSDAFSIGLWVKVPSTTTEGVIFHKNKGARLHCYRGFHLYLRDNKLEWVMARIWPDNAIIKNSLIEIPKDEWVHLMVTYDGSSSAAGTNLFINGVEIETDVERDNLYKGIIFHSLEDIIYPEAIEPNLQIGARWRGVGLKNGIVDEILVYNRQLTPLEILNIANPEKIIALKNNAPLQLTSAQKEDLSKYYLANHSNIYETALNKYETAQLEYIDSMEVLKEVMVMKEMETPRQSHILKRGLYDDYGEEVFPNTPKSVLPFLEEFPKNRLGLAQWLVHKDHPLTARVAVNRYWQNYFGRGLVKTAQDFGNQGDLPSHPALLDWLAVQFMDSGWDIKALQKLIVMSATYRQDSYTSEELLEKDKDNVWLARGPSIRLSSEMIRDNALAASGLLNKEVGGESVYPYQPEGLWALNFDPYPQDTGAKLYRRSLYTMWRRTNPNPTLSTFDQPNRDVCTVNRQKTNTPLQALVLLNDPTFVEAAKVIGENMTRKNEPLESIRNAYLQLTGKIPSDKELNLLQNMQRQEYEVFQANPQKSKGWLATGAYEIDPSLDQHMVAANAIVASVILNGDVAITKR